MGHELHTPCFSRRVFLFLHVLLTHTCPVSVIFRAHSQSKSHGLRMFKCHYLSPLHLEFFLQLFQFWRLSFILLLQFTSNSSRNLHIIYFLLLTRAFPFPPCSVSQLTTACYSTSPEIQSFYLTRLIRFLRCSHPVLH